MKLPKKTKRFCPYCKKQTEQKIELVSTGHKRGSLKWGSKIRARLRGKARGHGNMGRWSKPAVTKWKRKTKSTKRLVVLYTCQICKKSKPASFSRRVSKIQIEEPQKKPQ
jgi:large subunit ribosomal protein L44e